MFNFVKMFLIPLIFLLVTITISYAGSPTIGISPSYIDIGDLEPGESKIVKFYAVTTSEDLFMVSLSSLKGDMSLFQNNEKYKDALKFYSEEDITEWINFISNPLELLPPPEDLKKTKGGSSIKGMREIAFVLKVPKNAEPGYHTGAIAVDPIIPQSEEGSVYIKGLIPVKFIFKVKGNAERKGEILEITDRGIRGDKRFFGIIYKNTGNVTTSVDQNIIEIYNKNNLPMGNVKISSGVIKPSEVREFEGSIDAYYLDPGIYKLKAKVNYFSGEAEKESLFNITEEQIPLSGSVVEGQKSEFPWLILIIISFVIILCYILLKK